MDRAVLEITAVAAEVAFDLVKPPTAMWMDTQRLCAVAGRYRKQREKIA